MVDCDKLDNVSMIIAHNSRSYPARTRNSHGIVHTHCRIWRVEHEDFRKIIERRVFVPAGMTTASYFVNERDNNLAAGHANGRVIWEEPTDCKASQAAGGIVASVTDFAHFAGLLLRGGGSVLSKNSVNAMLRGRVLMDEPAGVWEDTAGALGKFVIVAKPDQAEYFVTRVGVARRVSRQR